MKRMNVSSKRNDDLSKGKKRQERGVIDRQRGFSSKGKKSFSSKRKNVLLKKRNV